VPVDLSSSATERDLLRHALTIVDVQRVYIHVLGDDQQHLGVRLVVTRCFEDQRAIAEQDAEVGRPPELRHTALGLQ
jgi:hypothetical protein